MHEDEIRSRVVSEDPTVLARSCEVAAERATLERQRADRAEGRAATILAATGVIGGFLAYFGATVRAKDPPPVLWIAVFVFGVAFLLKAAYYAVRASWALKGNELTPELALELQDRAHTEALREELVWRLWECYQLQRVSVRRLFMLNRAQRNFVQGLGAFAALATLELVRERVDLAWPVCVVIPLVVLMALWALIGDGTAERLGTTWKRPNGAGALVPPVVVRSSGDQDSPPGAPPDATS